MSDSADTVLAIFAASIVGAIASGVLLILFSTRIAAGFFPRFAHALAAVILIGIGWLVACHVIGRTLAFGGYGMLALCVSAFVINTAVVAAVIRRPDGRGLGWSKALAISIIQLAIEIVIAFVIMLMAGAEVLLFLGKLH